MSKRNSAENGFSIIEALVAAVIAATAVTQFYASLGTGILLDARTGKQSTQTLTALSVLDTIREEAAQGKRILPGQNLSGELNGIRWTAQIRDAATEFTFDWLGPGALTSVHISIGGQEENTILTGYIPGVTR